MKQGNKWIIGSVGLAICFYVGWFFPLLWLLWLIGVVVLLVIPTTPETVRTVASQPVTYVPANAQSVDSDTVAQIEALIQAESDTKVRAGLKQALSVIKKQTTLAAQPTVVTMPTAPVVSEAELAERKQRQDLRNTNTILYTASFLLVGAAALFIGLNGLAGPWVKFMTLFIVASLFYGVGLWLHAASTRLKPAATAFVGTGLALIPFVGLALNSFVVHDPALAWWITSLVGLAAFLNAVRQIRSTVMTYLTLAFVFSLATSTVSVLDAPFVWYFVAIILTSSFMMYAAYRRPSWLPESSKRPLEENAQIAAPAALVGSLFMFDTFTSFEYVLISGIGALHYLVNALGYATDKTRFGYWFVARGLCVVFAATMTYHFTDTWTWTAYSLLLAGVLTHAYSIRAVRRYKQEEVWLWLSMVLMVLSLSGYTDDMISISAIVILLIILGLCQLNVMRRLEYALVAVIAAVSLPLTLLRGVAEPPVGYEVIGIVTLLLAVGCVFLRWLLTPRHMVLQQAASVFYMAFIAETLVLAALGADWMVFGTVTILAGILLHVSSFIERHPYTTVVSNVMLAIGLFALYGQTFDSYTWVPLATGLTLAAIWYALSWYHRRPEAVSVDDQPRSVVMAVSAISILGLAALIAMFQTDQTIVAGALTGCVTAALIAYEGARRRVIYGYEVAIYIATFSLQRLVAHVYPDASWLVYTHWWALSAGIVALLYFQRTGNRTVATVRAVIALTILSLPTGLTALIDSGYRTLFLFEHVALAVAGLAVNKRLAVLWGAIGVGLAVLYMLQGYTYILLTLIAFGLIGLAIWRLTKKG